MHRYISIFILAVVSALFVACDNGNDNFYGHPWSNGDGGNNSGQSTALNTYEQKLMGSYVSDDDPSSVFYLVLYIDRTGYYKTVNNGQTSGQEFTWSATSNTLTVVFTQTKMQESFNYYYTNDHLYVDNIPLVVNNGESTEETSPLIGQWQGANTYYNAIWGLVNDSCQTIVEFTTNGAGCQLDYDIYNPTVNFAYTPFTWTKTDSVITLTYATGGYLTQAVISGYALTSASMSGKINVSWNNGNSSAAQDSTFNFIYTKVTGFDWNSYIQSTAKQTAKTGLKRLRMSSSTPITGGTFAK